MGEAAVTRWVRRVWAGDPMPALGDPGVEGWWEASLPFSFVYVGRPSRELLPAWRRRTTARESGNGNAVFTVVLTDPETGLAFEWQATTYADVPAVKWIVTLRNGGAAVTEVLEQVRALDLTLATDFGELVVYHATGGHATPDAFQPRETVLSRSESFRLASVGGRSSNGMLPYFNVETNWHGHNGLVVAVGWSGQWEATLTRLHGAPPLAIEPDLRGPNPALSSFRAADRLRLEAGMQGLRVRLRPGEEIRTPRILLIPWEGDRLHGQNRLRRVLHRHVAPPLAGEPPSPAIWTNLGIVDPSIQLLGAGRRHIDVIPEAAALGVDYVVLDAGWYESHRWVTGVGNYTVRKDLFPQGLRPLADAVRAEGRRFGLWFEPERVAEGTQVFHEHREWLYPTPLRHGYVFNLGIPEARAWLTDTISRLIDEIGVEWYWHDANADYLPVWQANDSTDRQGISELRQIEGLYEFWADLLRRHPGLHIEGCASGGRRMDFEALRYHHSYWHTDWMVGDPAGMQSQIHGASQWFPGNYRRSGKDP